MSDAAQAQDLEHALLAVVQTGMDGGEHGSALLDQSLSRAHWCVGIDVGNLLLCGLCERASAPVCLTGADSAAALNPPANTRPVVSFLMYSICASVPPVRANTIFGYALAVPVLFTFAFATDV